MDTKAKILARIKKKKAVTGRELREALCITRQAVHAHLKALIQEGKVIKEGGTRKAVYKPASARKGSTAPGIFRKTYPRASLEEDRVFKEVSLHLQLEKRLRENVHDILFYAYTEMMNNAIEHSESRQCETIMELDTYEVHFKVRDTGIGIFHSIASKLNLPDESAALGELLKGKTTTMKDRHTGEGVFFTSKAGDRISFRSHRMELSFDNTADDVIVMEKRFLPGTEVRFALGRRSRRNLEKVFADYAPEQYEYRFERTRVLVKFHAREYISRSEARRMLAGLDKFSEVVFDFSGVKTLGQGFADEVFRVFQNRHPGISLQTAHAGPSIAQVIRHVVDNKK